jgi:hypothetical protein
MSVSATLTSAPGCSLRRFRPALAARRLPLRTVATGPAHGTQVSAWPATASSSRPPEVAPKQVICVPVVHIARRAVGLRFCRKARVAGSHTYAPDCMPLAVAAIFNSALSFVSGRAERVIYGYVRVPCRHHAQAFRIPTTAPRGLARRQLPRWFDVSCRGPRQRCRGEACGVSATRTAAPTARPDRRCHRRGTQAGCRCVRRARRNSGRRSR